MPVARLYGSRKLVVSAARPTTLSRRNAVVRGASTTTLTADPGYPIYLKLLGPHSARRSTPPQVTPC
jgi:hypothetical protein